LLRGDNNWDPAQCGETYKRYGDVPVSIAFLERSAGDLTAAIAGLALADPGPGAETFPTVEAVFTGPETARAGLPVTYVLSLGQARNLSMFLTAL
jgi:hypothetical protein